MALNNEQDEVHLKDTESIKAHLRSIFRNRGLPVEEGRLDRIAGEIESGERGFVDVRISLRPYAKKNGDVGIPDDVDTDGPKDASEMAEYIRGNYPSMAWALDHPELGPLLKQAAEEEWTPAKWLASYESTDFFAENSATQRQFYMMREADPVEYERQVEGSIAIIEGMAQRMGYSIPPAKLRELATDRLAMGMNEDQVREGLIAAASPLSVRGLSSGDIGGTASEVYNAVEGITNQYVLDLPNDQMQKWVTDINNGTRTVDGFRQFAQKMAREQMPFMRDSIDQGLNPEDVFDTYRGTIAETLEMAPGNIDFRKEKWRNLIRVNDGQERLASQEEVNRMARQNFTRQWERTTRARNQALELTQQIAETFGRVG